MRRLMKSGAKFLVVGGISTAIEVSLFNLFVLVSHWDPVVAKIAASLVALVNAYIGNREWAFRHRRGRGRGTEVAFFLLVNGVCTALGAGFVAVGVAMVDDAGALALNVINLASIAIVVVIRFLLYHFLVFRSSTPRAGSALVPTDLDAEAAAESDAAGAATARRERTPSAPQP